MDIPDFEFNSDEGLVRLSDYAGKFVVLVFGYTYCPDACPTTMARVSQVANSLDTQADQVQVALVSVDPARDTPEKLKAYVETFNPSFAGLAVTTADSASFFKTLGIYHEKAQQDTTEQNPESTTSNYLVDHTTSTVVLDRNGNWRLVWNFELNPEEMAADLKTLIDAQ